MKFRILFASAVAIVVAIACGDDGDSNPGPGASGNGGSGAAAGSASGGSAGSSGSTSGSGGSVAGSGGTAGSAGSVSDGGPDAPMDGSDAEPERQLSLLAGQLGGPGYVDDVGPDARFNSPRSIAISGNTAYIADTQNDQVRTLDLTTKAVGTAFETQSVRSVVFGSGTKLYVSSYTAVYEYDTATSTRTLLAGHETDSGSDDGVGANARFQGGNDLAFDGTDTLYIADDGNHTVRKLVLSTKTVSTFVGTTGDADYVDGIGTAAKFDAPNALALDGGTLYVSDFRNFLIRSVDVASRTVSTLAGTLDQFGTVDGPAATARFANPTSLWLDNGSLFVGELGVIRALDLTTQTVSTVAGVPYTVTGLRIFEDGTGASARMGRIAGAAIAGGVTYVVDSEGAAVRTLTGGTLTTIAGALPSKNTTDGPLGTGRLATPLGMDWDGANRVFIADQEGHRIRQYDRSTGAVTTIAGSTAGYADGVGSAARFFQPTDVAFDGVNSLYVGGQGNSVMRKIDLTTNEVTTVLGQLGQMGNVDGIGSAARTNGSRGIEFDGGTYMYFVDGDSVRRLNIATNEATTIATAVPGCSFPTDVAVQNNFAYVMWNGRICRIDLTDFSSTQWATLAHNARSLAIGPDGDVLYGSGSGVSRVDLTTAAMTELFMQPAAQAVRLGPTSTASINYASDVLALGTGELLLLDSDEHSLLELK